MFFSLLVWFVDLLTAFPPDWASGLAGLFFNLLFVVPLSLATGLFFRVVWGRSNPYVIIGVWGSSLWSFLVRPDGERGFTWLMRGLSLAAYLGAALVLSFMLCREIALEVIRPRYQSILSITATMGAFIAALPIYIFGVGVGRLLARPLARVPVLALLYARPLGPSVAGFAGLVGVGVAFLVHFEEAVAASPWKTPTLLVIALGGAVAFGAMLCIAFASRRVLVVYSVVFFLVSLAAALGAVSLNTDDVKARQHFSRTRGTRLAYRTLAGLLDRDGDGYMHQFAGGDCAPLDGRVSPAAIDVPGNGVDEDCSGSDVEYSSQEGGRWDYPLPRRFPKRRLPVFLVIVDALSADHLSFMGYDRQTTPALAEMCRRCVVFDKAFSQGPSTRLSMASMFTGLYDSQVVRGEGRKVPYTLSTENHTLAELMRDNGYDTVAVVPNSYFFRRWKGITQGFDTVDKSAAVPRTRKGKATHNAEAMTGAALRHVRESRDDPLFMWVHYYDCHPPFVRPPGMTDYGPERQDLYDSEVEHVDMYLEKLITGLDDEYGRRGYLLILAADHGSSFDANHPRRSHGYDLHTSVLHIPLLFCSSHIPAQRVGKTAVSLLDVVPTLVNLLGLGSSTAFEGSSLVPLLFDEAEWPERMVFHQFFLAEKERKGADPLYAASVHTATHNYLWDRKEDRYLLFDYAADPFETRDLLETEPGLARQLDSVLKTWLFRVYGEGMGGGEFDYEDGGGPDEDYSLEY